MKQKIYKNYNFKKIMGKIVAIGGGEIGRPGTKIETLEIDTEIIKLTNKKNPKLLFIPTASNDSTGYYDVVKNYFGKKLGCDVSVLYLINETHTKKNIENKILSSDIIYVGGGNTLKMMTLWRKYEVDKILKKAYDNGIVMTGISAGSICWFNFGNSDSRKFTSDSSKLIKVTENFRLGVFAATGAIGLMYLVSFILGMFGIHVGFIHDNGWMSIGISVVIVVIASLNLILDFDFIEKGSEQGAPKYMEWYAAFGLMVTLIWLYIEILRLLSKLRSR